MYTTFYSLVCLSLFVNIFAIILLFTKAQDVNRKACIDGEATLTSSYGYIASPNFPRNYDNNVRCLWIIRAPANKMIEVFFEHFQLESSDRCEYDYVEIFDGSERYTGARFCGRITPIPFNSATSKVSIIFNTDRSGRSVGFKLSWNLRDRCTSSQFMCWDGSCIPAYQHCNSVTNCNDNSDEIECAHGVSGLYAECGKQEVPPKFTWRPRIIGGNQAVEGSWPWFTALTTSSTLYTFCGGSVIHPKAILTAAHCLKSPYNNKDNIRVVVGRTLAKGTTGEQVMRVSRMHSHPGFVDKIFTKDIAILELENEIVYSEKVRPICVAQWNDTRFEPRVGETCITVGFGDIDPSVTKISPSSLYQVRLKIFNFTDCIATYNLRSTANIGQSQLCTYSPGADSCQGDSGGPLMCLFKANKEEKWYQVGITSFGVDCADSFPGVYQKPSYYSEWIKEKINEIEACSSSGVTLRETTGTIKSPNHPNPYHSLAECRWDIIAALDQVIEIKFPLFSLHKLCNNVNVGDFLRIIDGNVLKYKYCGPMRPQLFTSTHNKVSFIFNSDASGNGAGFFIEWKMVAAPEKTTLISVNPEGPLVPPNVARPDETSENPTPTIKNPDPTIENPYPTIERPSQPTVRTQTNQIDIFVEFPTKTSTVAGVGKESLLAEFNGFHAVPLLFGFCVTHCKLF